MASFFKRRRHGSQRRCRQGCVILERAYGDAHHCGGLGLGQVGVVRSATTSRCRAGRVRSAEARAERSSCMIGSYLVARYAGASPSATTRCRSTERDRFTTA
jgi:hypothetical protein